MVTGGYICFSSIFQMNSRYYHQISYVQVVEIILWKTIFPSNKNQMKKKLKKQQEWKVSEWNKKEKNYKN